jgi:6-phosphogluconolactonase
MAATHKEHPITHFLSFDSRDEASAQLAAEIATQLHTGIVQRGAATLAVCSGTSPVALFKKLRTIDLAWSRVTIVATDERLVAPTHERSNEGMIRRLLLRERASVASLVSLYVEGHTPTSSLSLVTYRLAAMASPFDAVVLGMGLGLDEHTASLLPDATHIDAMLASRADCVVPEFSDDRTQRISLGPARLLVTRNVYLLLFGDDKRSVYDRALEHGPLAEFPVRMALHQTRAPVTSYWSR